MFVFKGFFYYVFLGVVVFCYVRIFLLRGFVFIMVYVFCRVVFFGFCVSCVVEGFI